MVKKYRNKRKYLFVLLLIAISFMSVGFATFSTELTISSNAIVKPDSGDFRVMLSSSGTSFLTDKITGIATGDATAGFATIGNGNESSIISDLSATFTGPGQSVKYEFYVYNAGAYVAYLKEIKFYNVGGESSNKVCTTINSSSALTSLMQKACNDINVAVQIGSTTVMNSTSGITGSVLEKGAYLPVSVTISYSNNENNSDEDFIVEFGDIGIIYSSADGTV